MTSFSPFYGELCCHSNGALLSFELACYVYFPFESMETFQISKVVKYKKDNCYCFFTTHMCLQHSNSTKCISHLCICIKFDSPKYLFCFNPCTYGSVGLHARIFCQESVHFVCSKLYFYISVMNFHFLVPLRV